MLILLDKFSTNKSKEKLIPIPENTFLPMIYLNPYQHAYNQLERKSQKLLLALHLQIRRIEGIVFNIKTLKH